MIVHNVVRYLFPLKLKKPFILAFYALASLQMLSRILELIYIANASGECVSITDAQSLGQLIADQVATLANVALCLLFIISMNQITA